MNPEQAEKTFNGIVDMLTRKKIVYLTVEVADREQAEELIEWMYSEEKPMKCTLLRMSCDQQWLTDRAREALNILLEEMRGD